jgi:hypothetical protein
VQGSISVCFSECPSSNLTFASFRSLSISMLVRLFLLMVALHCCLAAWADVTKPVVKADGNLNPDHAHLAGWLNPEALVNMGDSQLLDGSSFSWTPAKGTLAATSHVNGPMVKRNQANGFPVVRFLTPTGNGAAIKFDDPTGSAATMFIVARLDLSSTSNPSTYQHLWSVGGQNGFAVSKSGAVLVGQIGDDPPVDDAGTSSTASSSTINSGSWHIFAIDALSGSHVGFVDGTAGSPLANSATPFVTASSAYSAGAYQIGNDESLANGVFQGDVAEVCSYSAPATSRPLAHPCFSVHLVQNKSLRSG